MLHLAALDVYVWSLIKLAKGYCQSSVQSFYAISVLNFAIN